MNVKIKKLHPDAIIPKYAKPGDAGLDLVALDGGLVDQVTGNVTFTTGLAVEIPEGYVGLIFPRSSISKTGMALSNAVGVIDSGYRGEIMLKFNLSGTCASMFLAQALTERKINTPPVYLKGDKIGQLIILPYPKVEFEEVEELSDTERGEGGFGSTGK